MRFGIGGGGRWGGWGGGVGAGWGGRDRGWKVVRERGVGGNQGEHRSYASFEHLRERIKIPSSFPCKHHLALYPLWPSGEIQGVI